MSHKRTPKGKAVIAASSVAALGAAALILPNAMASQDEENDAAAPKTVSALQASGMSSQVKSLLGEAFAGSYYDEDKQRLVVNVVGDNDNVILRAEKAGVVVRKVDNSMFELKAAEQTLKSEATIPGTSWFMDPRTNRIQVLADSTVTGSNWDQVESAVKSLGSDMASVEKTAGEFKTLAAGGDAIFGGGSRCSLGFNVTAVDGSPAFLTAGHCGVLAAVWSAEQGGEPIGTTDGSTTTFPGAGDFALVHYNDQATEAPSTVNLGGEQVDIKQAAEAEVGMPVTRMGSTTGQHSGTVTAINSTVNLRSGATITGLILTDVCGEPGDSGGPLFNENSAIGLASAASGDCTVGGRSFYQPVTTALAATRATIGDGGNADGAPGGGDAASAGIRG